MRILPPNSKCYNISIQFPVIHQTTLPTGNCLAHHRFPIPLLNSLPRYTSTLSTKLKSQSPSNAQSSGASGGYDPEDTVQDLRVPDHWSLPSKALEESEWLRVSLHKWLDDEYCPEETNVEISKVAAGSFYKSLLQKETDLGEILLRMARDLESVSYQESFHGAFSSANAAVNLILQRIELQGQAV